MPAKPMSFLIFGVGAIGTYVGASLAMSGQKVTFIERPELVPVVKENGLKLRIANSERGIKSPDVVGSVSEACAMNNFDAAILAVKSFDTPAVLESIIPYASHFPPILCLQNGVENEILIGKVLGVDKVIPGTVTTAVGRLGIGQVVVEKLRGIGIASTLPISTTLVEVFTQAGLRAKGYQHPDGMKWSKMLTNLLANTSSAILDYPPTTIFSHQGLFQVEMAMVKEALAVMRGLGYPVVDLPSTPVRALTSIIQHIPEKFSRPLLYQALGKGRGAKMPSFHIDLYGGRGKSEVDYLNGAVVRYGEKVGIPTPVNTWMTRILTLLTNGELAKEELAHQPEKYLDWLSRNLP